MFTSCSPPPCISYRNQTELCFPAHGRNQPDKTVFSLRVQAPLESALPQKVSMCLASGLSSFFYLGRASSFLDAFSKNRPVRKRGISCRRCLFLSTD